MSLPENYRAPYVAGPPPTWQQTGPQTYTTQQFTPPTGGFRPPKKKRNTLAIVLWCVFGVLALVIGLAVIGAVATSATKKPVAATPTTAGPVQQCDHGHLADGSCAGGNGPTETNAAYLEVARPLFPGIEDDKLLELGSAMCEVLDRSGGDVGQLMNVDAGTPKETLLKAAQASGRYLCPRWMTATQGYTIPVKAANSIEDGRWIVGEDFPAGTYQTTASSETCYWDVTTEKADGSKHYVKQEVGPGHYRTALKKGQNFSTADCGTWTKVG